MLDHQPWSVNGVLCQSIITEIYLYLYLYLFIFLYLYLYLKIDIPMSVPVQLEAQNPLEVISSGDKRHSNLLIPNKKRCFPLQSFHPKFSLLCYFGISQRDGAIACSRWGSEDCGAYP